MLREMIENSKNWAKTRGLYIERHEVHGCEEWRIPTTREFEFNKRNQQSAEYTGRFEIQARNIKYEPLGPLLLTPYTFLSLSYSDSLRSGSKWGTLAGRCEGKPSPSVT